MSRAKRDYNRQNKKTKYNLGDLVLVSHPTVKKGLSRGLAPRYYGPFTIVGRYKNGCDYLIKDMAKSQSKAKQIHVNNLKTYFDRGQPEELDRTQKSRPAESSDEREVPNNEVNQSQRIDQGTMTVPKQPTQTDHDRQYSASSSESNTSDEEIEKQGIFWRAEINPDKKKYVAKAKPGPSRARKIAKPKINDTMLTTRSGRAIKTVKRQ